MSQDPTRTWPKDTDRMTLTPSRTIWYVENRYENMLASSDTQGIKDKSRPNGLAKDLVCIQVMWLCLQFSPRPAETLSVSLLELNTFVHVLFLIPFFS